MATESDRAIKSRCKILSTAAAVAEWRQSLGAQSLAFVPTMGALHEGHMALVSRARAQCQKVIVSIFVNPLQFAPHEDLSRYPRPFEKDVELCEAAGVDAIFHPSVQEIYGDKEREATTTVTPPASLTATLEGAFRPGHFTGVATVVSKLFNIVQAHSAYFGEKDYQQLQIICAMVRDLNIPTNIVPVPTVREPDGLALSSRNVYLSAEQRKIAPKLQATLVQVRDAIERGTSPQAAIQQGRAELEQISGIVVQYLEACNATTLQPLEQKVKPYVVLVAAKLGDVRLIDNVIVR